MSFPRSVLRAVGSLWFAAVLLVLLLVAMACATVVESTESTERALADFYTDWWFKALLALVGVNVLAAMLLRFPFTRRHIGFVLTHGGIIVTLLGALVTQHHGVNGRVALAEGESADQFTAGGETLALARGQGEPEAAIDLPGAVFGGLDAADQPRAPELVAGDVRVRIQRYLPDGKWVERVTDDSPQRRGAVEVCLSGPDGDSQAWILTGRKASLGSLAASYHVATDPAELRRLLEPAPDEDSSAKTVKVEHQGTTFEYPLEDCLEKAVPLGDTGHTIRVLRYLPHATVGADNKVVSVSDEPVNPAVEAEFTAPDGQTETRLAFARFPDFSSMHGGEHSKDFKLTFVAGSTPAPGSPITVVADTDGKLHARLEGPGAATTVTELSLGQPAATPWPGRTLTVLRKFGNANANWIIEPIDPPRAERTPAVQVRLTSGEHTSKMWVEKYRPRSVTVDGTAYELRYLDRQIPLGFEIKLNRFRVGTYPGTGQPRSFESHVTITDPETGLSLDRLISMNNPTSYGAYTFYQSSYRMGDGPAVSVLSVARDPGQIVAFAGYVLMIVGMVVVLVTRIVDRKRLGLGVHATGAAADGLVAIGGLPPAGSAAQTRATSPAAGATGRLERTASRKGQR